MPSHHHGSHIKVVGYADEKRLGSVANIRAFLVDLVGRLGMRPLGEPVMHDVELDLSKLNVEPFEDEGGITGVVVLSTSHCSIHTWPARKLYVLDVYSCRDFGALKVIDAIDSYLGQGAKRVTDVSDSLVPPPPQLAR